MSDVPAEWLECEITSVTTCPPPWPGIESQQPLVSPNPKSDELPVKSLSSHAMKIAEFPVHAGDDMILPTVSERNESPVLMRSCVWLKLHWSEAGPPRPCMSWHWSGLIQT